MAQTISICEVYNDEYSVVAVTSCEPDINEVEEIAMENEMSGDVVCEYISYNIGEGESGIDYFFSEEELLEMYKSKSSLEFEKEIEKLGYEISTYSSGTVRVYIEEEDEGDE